MKMWHCAFASLILIIVVWLFSYGILKTEDFNRRTSIEVNIVNNDDGEVMFAKNESEVFKIPNAKVKQHVPKFMLELYEKSKKVKKENSGMAPDIVKSVIPAYEGSHYPYLLENDINNDHHMLVFNVPSSNKDEIFIRAELQVLTLIEIKSKLALGIERQIKISIYNETTNELKILEERHIYHTDNTWISFNVSHAVNKVLLDPYRILKLVITVKLYQPFINNKTGVFKLSLMPITENYEHNYPVLLLFYTSAKMDAVTNNQQHKNLIVQNGELKHERSRRVRRYVEEDYEEETNKLWDDDVANKAMSRKMKRMRNNCKKRPLFVDFAEINYDSWIVQPSGYEAYQCSGKCFYPVADYLSPTKHAIVQALLHSVSPSRAPRSCCVPTKLDSISVLYVDAQGVLTYRDAMETRLNSGLVHSRKSRAVVPGNSKPGVPFLKFLRDYQKKCGANSVKDIAKDAARKWRLLSAKQKLAYGVETDGCGKKRRRKSKPCLPCCPKKRRRRSSSCGKKKRTSKRRKSRCRKRSKSRCGKRKRSKSSCGRKKRRAKSPIKC